MLHIYNYGNLMVGQVLCLHLAGQPEPDLGTDSNFYVRFLLHDFYLCDKRGALLKRSRVFRALIVMMRTDPTPKTYFIPIVIRFKITAIRIKIAPDVNFVPVIQLSWDDVQSHEGGEDKKYLIYNPDGALLQWRIDRDGSINVDDDPYEPLYYRPEHNKFTLRDRPVREDTQHVLRTFADKSGCGIGALIFVPSD